MRPVKALLLGVMICALGAMWTNRDFVVDAYRLDDTEGTDVRLEGVNLSVQRTDVGPSPYEVAAAPDVRRAAIPAVYTPPPEAEEPVEVEMTGGGATLAGTVLGPDGPAYGGIVRLERHTEDGIGTVDVRVGNGGGWSRGDLPGGRYRLRAFVPGHLTMSHSEVLFVDGDSTTRFDFVIGPVDPQPVLEFVHGGPMYHGLTGTVAVSVSQRAVDGDGRVVVVPIPGAVVAIQTSPIVSPLGASARFTDDKGAARFLLRCNSVGSGRLLATYGHVQSSFALPGCRPIPKPKPPVPPPTSEPPTPVPTPAPSTTTAPAPTSTTEPVGRSAQTQETSDG